MKQCVQMQPEQFVPGLVPEKKLDRQITVEPMEPDVVEFLESINLQKYQKQFTRVGISDMETVLELQDTHLEAMGIPLGYKLKILKRIKILRQEKGMQPPESRGRPDTA